MPEPTANNPYCAKCFADLISPMQLVAVRTIGNAAKIEYNVLSETLFQSSPEYLSKDAASLLITALRSLDILQVERGEFVRIDRFTRWLTKTSAARIRLALDMLARKGRIRTRGHGQGKEYAAMVKMEESAASLGSLIPLCG